MNYRITKYNPEFRDENGFYKKDEWTSISDIGKKFNKIILTKEEYKKTENNYIDAIYEILREKDIKKLKLYDLEINKKNLSELSSDEKDIIKEINNDKYLDFKKSEKIIRLVLREMLWCKFCSELKDIKIEFGYDYYMYVECSKIKESTINIINKKGLFVEIIN